MDLSPSSAEAAFRTDIRSWLREHLPWEYGKGLPPRFDDLADEVAFGRRWQAQLAADRWVGVTWPEVYGGRGAGPTEHFIVQEELARARAPDHPGGDRRFRAQRSDEPVDERGLADRGSLGARPAARGR